jgi:hypothetical protein
MAFSIPEVTAPVGVLWIAVVDSSHNQDAAIACWGQQLEQNADGRSESSNASRARASSASTHLAGPTAEAEAPSEHRSERT